MLVFEDGKWGMCVVHGEGAMQVELLHNFLLPFLFGASSRLPLHALPPSYLGRQKLDLGEVVVVVSSRGGFCGSSFNLIGCFSDAPADPPAARLWQSMALRWESISKPRGRGKA